MPGQKHRAWVLVGPTAAGKTDIAHALALRLGTWVLSADSMLIYRGLDIGTAKPTPAQRNACAYFGVDLVDPSQSFSVHDYLRHVASIPPRQWATPPVIVGGTGLYISALLYGLDAGAGPDPALRETLESRLAEGGVEALRNHVRESWPGLLETLEDPMNPRRIIRAAEKAAAGSGPGTRIWSDRRDEISPVTGLTCSRETLRARIAARVDRMFADGLLDEAAALRRRIPSWSDSALQAIGYREAFEALDGVLTRDEARDRIVTRTTRLAKRQMTWFRRQVPVRWIETDGRDAADIVHELESDWTGTHGNVDLHLGT